MSCAGWTLSSMVGGGHALKYGVLVYAALKTTFSCPPGHLQDPHFSIFSVLPQITNLKIFSTPKLQNWERVLFQSLKLGLNSVHKATFCSEIQFFKVPNSAVVPSQAPLFSPKGHLSLLINDSWLPLGLGDILMSWSVDSHDRNQPPFWACEDE